GPYQPDSAGVGPAAGADGPRPQVPGKADRADRIEPGWDRGDRRRPGEHQGTDLPEEVDLARPDHGRRARSPRGAGEPGDPEPDGDQGDGCRADLPAPAEEVEGTHGGRDQGHRPGHRSIEKSPASPHGLEVLTVRSRSPLAPSPAFSRRA